MNEILISKLNKLNQNEINFINWFKQQQYSFMLSNVKTIADVYGTGMSFIYTLLKKLELNHFKELVFLLTQQSSLENSETENIFNKKDKTIFDSLFELQTKGNLANHILFKNQKDKLEDFCDLLFKSKNVYGIGLGHAFLALKDLSGFYKRINPNFKVFDNNNFSSIKFDECLFIVYSLRGKNSKLKQMIEKIKNNSGNKIILFTSNVNTSIANMADIVIEIHNVMKEQNPFTDYNILSPLNSWLFLNDLIKTQIWVTYKKEILKINDIVNEMISWDKNSYY
jgi:DNA-binding MurR/RpiR family transcriptional regulator